MLRWARGKTNKDHIKNEDIWRDANIEPMTTFLRQNDCGGKEYNVNEEMKENQSVWHMKTKAGSFLHGGGLVYVNETCGLRTVENI